MKKNQTKSEEFCHKHQMYKVNCIEWQKAGMLDKCTTLDDVELARKLGEVDELEAILEMYGDTSVQSPFNPQYTWIWIKQKLEKRLYQKKHRLKI